MQIGAYYPAVAATLPPHLLCASNGRHSLCFLLLVELASGASSPALPPPQPASFSPAACCRLHVVPRHNTLFSQRNSAAKHAVDLFYIFVCLRGAAVLAQAGAAHVRFARRSSERETMFSYCPTHHFTTTKKCLQVGAARQNTWRPSNQHDDERERWWSGARDGSALSQQPRPLLRRLSAAAVVASRTSCESKCRHFAVHLPNGMPHVLLPRAFMKRKYRSIAGGSSSARARNGAF